MLVRNDSGPSRPVTRSRSIFGSFSFKNLLPIKIFGRDGGGQPDTPGKRKGTVQEAEEAEEGQRSSKRQKVNGSPVRETTRPPGTQRRQQLVQPQPTVPTGYLEPPDVFFSSANNAGTHRQLGHIRSSSLAPLSRLPSNGPARVYSGGFVPEARSFARTQSMDPPNRQRPIFGTVSKPTPLSRDVSMDDGSFSKEKSVSPSRQPFRMRTALTPAPSGYGFGFGPDPTRRERNESEPPPLAQLVNQPRFVKAPSEAPVSRAAARAAPITLGALFEAQRTSKPTQRSHSSLKLSSDTSMQDMTENAVPATVRPSNQTDTQPQKLDVSKLDIMPTRVRQSGTVPAMFEKPQTPHKIALMHDRESGPGLGKADKYGASEGLREQGYSTKPYSGKGATKKLRERRRQEENEEKERDNAAAIETDEDQFAESSNNARALDEELVKELEKPSEPEPQPTRPAVPGRQQSSGRVGRQPTHRTHYARSKAQSRGGRFSALYEDEDEDAMDDGSKPELPKPKPTFAPPPGFSFAKDTVPINHSSSNTKDAPISSLPFSLIKSTSGPSPSTSSSAAAQESGKSVEKMTTVPLPGFSTNRDVPHPSPPITVAADSQAVLAPAPLTPLINTVPQIALIPPSPGNSSVLATAPKQPVAAQLDASLTGKGSSAVPDFFGNSSALSKPSAQVNLPSTFSLGIPPTNATSTAKDAPSLFSKAPEAKDGAAAPKSVFSLFGAASQASTPAVDAKNQAEANKVSPTPLFNGFGNTETVSTFPKTSTFAPLTSSEPPKAPEPVKETPAPAPLLFGQPAAKPAAPAPALASTFTFGAPATAADRPASTPSPLPFQFGASTQSAQPASAADSRPSTGDALKPSFSFAPPSTGTQPSAFGASSATPSPNIESAKATFVFGQPPAQSSTTPAPVAASTSSGVEAAKPSFNTFASFGQPSSSSAPEPAKPPFSFGNTTTPSTPTTEAKFTFGASTATPAPANGSMLFGGAANGTPTATRTVTPPKKDDSEVMMDESPVRGITMATPTKPELSKLSGGFGGLTPGGPSSPFGQPVQNGSFNFAAPSSPNPFAKTEAKPADKTPFSFGQPATTGGFTFPQKAPEANAASTAGGFGFGAKAAGASAAPTPGAFTSFGQKAPETNAAPANSFFNSPATPSSSSPSFGFGAPPQITHSTSFGQPASATSSAPSPNPFNQPSQSGGFFGGTTPTTAPSNAFTFGSQPASPAAPSAGLPGQNGNGGFVFGASNTATGSTPSPFTPSSALPPTGGPVFNMGAAPPPAPAGMAGRLTKKLPNRRGGKR